MIDLLMILAGLALLVLGAEYLVTRGSKIATRLRIPTLIVGLTIVSFGTSAPELCVSVLAALQASTEMALSNVNGSNIANIALVLGVASLIAPIPVDRTVVNRDLAVMVGVQCVLLALMYDGLITRIDGAILVSLGIIYTLWTVYSARQNRAEPDDMVTDSASDWASDIVVIGLSLVALVAGAELMVEGATQLALSVGISDRYVGLSVVAIGTSAPELATAVACARRGDTQMAIGNTLGSNIFNVVFVVGITALVVPISSANPLVVMDVLAALSASMVLVGLSYVGQMGRLIGVSLLGSYAVYMIMAVS